MTADSGLALLAGHEHAPHDVLGVQQAEDGLVFRALLPRAREAWLETGRALDKRGAGGLFEAPLSPQEAGGHVRFVWVDEAGTRNARCDPYGFAPTVGELDLHLFNEGRHRRAYEMLGAHCDSVEGVAGVRFAVWAPNAFRVAVVADFNDWHGREHPMRALGASGVWELFIPGVGFDSRYKFEITTQTGVKLQKSDPYGRKFEYSGGNAAVIPAPSGYAWGDADWLETRAASRADMAPMSVYEVHLGSWRRAADGGYLNYREIADRLVPYVNELGFTHIELLPVTEHPFDGSWGYQTTGYFAPTTRFGSDDDFRYLVDRCHQSGIGVLLDWVPAHFPRDEFGLARFDGTPLYEHADPRRGEHRDWDTLIFNYGRHEVACFLIASALFWLREYHLDGLRVDAVASMLYLDYSREPGEWVPNEQGGNENLEAVAFLRDLNATIGEECPGAVTAAEESTAWPGVTRPLDEGGLGFTLKWNMGWMHDTLRYLAREPVHRSHHHDELTFSMLYAFNEHFILPLSHDEVVHGKGSLVNKLPGDRWQRFATLRLLYAYQFTHPGKKLLFMGGELGQEREWNHDQGLDWERYDDLQHGVQALVRDLARLYRDRPALHARDHEGGGFEWVDCEDRAHSVYSYLRRGARDTLLVVLNLTPVVREGYAVRLGWDGRWRELVSSDSRFYGGSDVGNPGERCTEGEQHELRLTLPPLGAVILEHVG